MKYLTVQFSIKIDMINTWQNLFFEQFQLTGEKFRNQIHNKVYVYFLLGQVGEIIAIFVIIQKQLIIICDNSV